MKKARWVSAAVGTAVLTAGFALPATAAFASGPDGDGGVLSVLSGNTVNAPVSLPVNVCGVAVTLLGGANAGCAGGAASNTVIAGGSGGGNGNAGVASVGSGNNVNLPISAPVNICGVSGAVGGFANSGCQGGAVSNTVIAGGSGGGGNGNAGVISALSGNTVNAPVSVPVNVCGIAAAVVGFANGACVGGSTSTTHHPPADHAAVDAADAVPDHHAAAVPVHHGAADQPADDRHLVLHPAHHSADHRHPAHRQRAHRQRSDRQRADRRGRDQLGAARVAADHRCRPGRPGGRRGRQPRHRRYRAGGRPPSPSQQRLTAQLAQILWAAPRPGSRPQSCPVRMCGRGV